MSVLDGKMQLNLSMRPICIHPVQKTKSLQVFEIEKLFCSLFKLTDIRFRMTNVSALNEQHFLKSVIYNPGYCS